MEQDQQQARDNAAIMQTKMALWEVTASSGWPKVLQYAETNLQVLKDKAFLEEDPSKAEGLRRDARGAMLFWRALLIDIDRTKNLDLAPTKETFLDVAID